MQAYVSNPLTPSFCRAALEQIEALIDRVSHLYVGETPSQYIMECRARVQGIYGDYGAALRWWTILRRHNGKWAELSSHEVDRARRLLEENLEEETRDSTSLRLWLRAVRLARTTPSLGPGKIRRYTGSIGETTPGLT